MGEYNGAIVDNRRILMVRLRKAKWEARWAQLSQRFPPVRKARVNRLRSMGRTSNTPALSFARSAFLDRIGKCWRRRHRRDDGRQAGQWAS